MHTKSHACISDIVVEWRTTQTSHASVIRSSVIKKLNLDKYAFGA